MSLSKCQSIKVLDVTSVGRSQRPNEFFEIRLEYPNWDVWHPGQFVMIRPVNWELDMLWGRPFSICSASADSLTLFVQNVGRGTSRLATMKPGEDVALWGPLGNSFAIESESPTLMLAGGIGIAPFRGYVESHPHPENLSLFMAHRLPIECYPYHTMSQSCYCESLWERKPEDLQMIITALRERIKLFAEKNGLILCCGPTPFMQTVQQFALEFGARVQISLENRMACGVGACLGCVTRESSGQHVQVCTKGPVFWSDEVQL